MIATLKLLPLLLRRSGRQSAAVILLCAAGVGVASTIASTMLVAHRGLSEREERLVWRTPSEVHADDATALVRRSYELFEGERIDVVEIEPFGPSTDDDGRLPRPPGLPRAPRPGEAAVSPALAALIEGHSGDELGDRFGDVTAAVGDEGLTGPDELVAIVGRPAGYLGSPERPVADDDFRSPEEPSPVTAVSRFSPRVPDRMLTVYRDLGLVALVLVIVPAALLVGSSARLAAARREQRLAALRLAGATPRAVRGFAAAETAIGALCGALGGVLVARVAAPHLDGVRVAGTRWFPGDLALSVRAGTIIVAVATAVCVLVAVTSLRRVATSPLGVARSTDARRARWPRVVALFGSVAMLVVSVLSARDGGSSVAMVAALAIVMSTLAIVGPWMTAVLGFILGAAARRPATLIAARRITNDPAATYRVVGAVVISGMVAGFVAVVSPTAAQFEGGGRSVSVVSTTVDSGNVAELEREVVDFGGELRRDQYQPPSDSGADSTAVLIDLGEGSLERFRTATVPLRQGTPLVAATDDLWGDAALVDDIGTAAIVVLLASLLLAAAASLVAAAASVIDQRRTLRRLVLAGVDIQVLHRSRQWQSTLPLTVVTLAAIGMGIGCGAGIMIGSGLELNAVVTPSLLHLLGAIALALAIGFASAGATRPLLVAATRLDADPD